MRAGVRMAGLTVTGVARSDEFLPCGNSPAWSIFAKSTFDFIVTFCFEGGLLHDPIAAAVGGGGGIAA